MPNFTQEYRNTDVGMPVLTGVAPSLIGVLDAVLVNGGTAQAVTSLTQAGTTVTAVIPADVSLENLDWLVIAGATPAGANGTVQITFIDSTHFSYQAAAGLGAITGSITYKRAPLGWTKPFGATGNFAAYRMAAVETFPGSGVFFPQMYLRIEENGLTTGAQKEALATGYEAMSDINTGTGKFPTDVQTPISGTASRGGVCIRRSIAADATVRPWSLIGDGATFYLHINSDGAVTTGRIPFGFGAFTSFKAGDAFNILISGTNSFNTASPSSNNLGVSYASAPSLTPINLQGLYYARPMSQAGGSNIGYQICRMSTSGNLGGANTAIVANPSPVDGAVWVDSTMLFDANLSPRGRPRGLYCHCHNALVLSSDYDTVPNVAGLPGVTLMNLITSGGNSQGGILYDRYGPW